MKPTNHARQLYLLFLMLRTIGFLLLVGYALCEPAQFSAEVTAAPDLSSLLTVIWLVLMLSMVLRFFPSRTESLGCQKEFAGRYTPTGTPVSPEDSQQADHGALLVLLSWVALNSVFFLGYRMGWLDARFMVCLASFYSVCDIICILFFCPFQSWMMHNRCCTTCRIYNWDYLMMCTPLLALRGILPFSACAVAFTLFVRWEFTYARRKERFFERSNASLRCSQCEEHLCKYKRALASKPSPTPETNE